MADLKKFEPTSDIQSTGGAVVWAIFLTMLWVSACGLIVVVLPMLKMAFGK
jgi:hypothetical protein